MIDSNMTPVRWWRLRPWSGNPLMRRSDRIESVVILIVAVTVLLLVPLAGAIGTAAHARLTDQARSAAASGRQVQALLLENSRPPVAENPTRAPTGHDQVRAQWEVDGTERSGLVDTDVGAEAGQTVTVWIDTSGNYMHAPNTGTENAIEAISVAFAFLMLGTTAGGLLLLGIRCLLAAYRRSGWQREWQSLEHTPGRPVN